MTKLWFKTKKYGWGWYPSTWQGLLIIGIYIAYMAWRSISFDKENTPLPLFLLEIIGPTIILFIICYLKGEKPGWQWGEKDKG